MSLPSDDAGLWKRGFLLFAFVALLAAGVLFVVLRRPETSAPQEVVRPEAVLTLVVQPGAGFPGSIHWGALYQLQNSLPSSPGWLIRYNATLALARRGSAKTDLGTVAEMLDEQRQLRNFRARREDGSDVPDEAAAGRTVLNALRAFVDWSKKNEGKPKVPPNPADLQQVYAAMDTLTSSSNPVLRTEAEKARKALEPR